MRQTNIIQSIAVPTFVGGILLTVTIAATVLPRQFAEEKAIKKEIAINFLKLHGNCSLAKKWDKNIKC